MNFVVFCLTEKNDMDQEKEYKETLEAFNEKNKEKTHLVSMLMEVIWSLEQIPRADLKCVSDFSLAVTG